MTRVLDVRDLRVSFPAPGGRWFHPVDGVSFTLDRGETLALVGESGSGKSLTSLALLKLIPPPGRVDPSSSIRLGEADALALQGEALRRIRGKRIGMIFQEPVRLQHGAFCDNLLRSRAETPKAARIDRCAGGIACTGTPLCPRSPQFLPR